MIDFKLTCAHLHVIQFQFHENVVQNVRKYQEHNDNQKNREKCREELSEHANSVHLVEVREGRSHEDVIIYLIRFQGADRHIDSVDGCDVMVSDRGGLRPVKPVPRLYTALGQPAYIEIFTSLNYGVTVKHRIAEKRPS